MSAENWAGNHAPEMGALAMAPVRLLPLRLLPVYVGSHIRSKPLLSLFAISELEPSDSAGGLAQT